MQSFNRTFMELKSEESSLITRGADCFNRTFMELKSLQNCIRGCTPAVSIVPLCN